MFCRIVAIIAILTFVPAFPLWAIGVDPTRFIFQAETGKQYSGQFKVTNDHDQDMQVDIEVNKGIDSGENAGIVKDSAWLAPAENTFTLRSGETKTVEFTVTVPNGTAGTFSAKISFIDRSNEAFSSSVTIPVYVVIKGTEIVDWEIGSFEIVQTPAGLSGGVKVENKGNVHFYAKGRISIKDNKGIEILNTQIGGGRAVFPHNNVVLPADLSKLTLSDGKYKVDVEVKGYGDQSKNVKYLLQKKGSKYNIRRL